ncbi:MAG: metallopeptidase family protein [Candidatus Omnitrophica bacterium]|nr:metallopeptidase family protein [Candidatus Omnitrophota bacterium]
MNEKEFEQMVLKAINELPEDYARKLENIDVVVEDMPDMETARKLKLGSRGRLLGLYQGIPLKDRTHYYGMVMPDKVTLYKTNIERVSAVTGKDLYEEVKHVLQHEIAHHFGISDQRLKDLDVY